MSYTEQLGMSLTSQTSEKMSKKSIVMWLIWQPEVRIKTVPLKYSVVLNEMNHKFQNHNFLNLHSLVQARLRNWWNYC